MRVHLSGDPNEGIFAQTVLRIGDGVFPTVERKVTIPLCLETIVTSL